MSGRSETRDLDGAQGAVGMAAGARAPVVLKIAAPLVLGCLFLGGWEALVRIREIPPYILPGPLLVLETLVKDWATLSISLWITLENTALAFAAAALGGLLLAILFAQSRIVELSLFPYAVILQVTPIVAIAPLIIIWVRDTQLALVMCGWIAAFFPVVSNATLGLNSTDHNLLDLFQLYGASRRQTLWQLRLPAALPYFLGGLRISGGLALIGTIVAEFVAGTAGAESGLAYRIIESGYRLNIPRMFACLLLLAAAGVAIFLALTALQHLALRRWHESAVRREE